MANLSGFNANNVEPAVGFEPIPEGDYTAVIATSENKPTKEGTGSYLELVFQVVDGNHKGRQLWSRLNLDNPNARAVQMAQAELSAICRAVGVMTPQDSLELHNLPMVISVKCRKRADTGEMTNEIRGYKKIGAVAVPANGTAIAGSAPPWARKS